MIFELTNKEKLDYPISLSEAKRHLNISEADDSDDGYIMDCLYSAVNDIEGYIGKDIAYTKNEQILRDFTGSVIELEIGNFLDVESIKSLDDPNVEYEVDYVKQYPNSIIIILKEEVSDDLFITYYSGYNVDETIPFKMKRAILIRVGDFYDVERQSYTMGNYTNTNAAYKLVNSYKLTKF